MERSTFVAPDISCEHCQRAIEEALSALPGVETVSVDIQAKSIDVSYDQSRTTREGLIACLDEEGYPVAG